MDVFGRIMAFQLEDQYRLAAEIRLYDPSKIPARKIAVYVSIISTQLLGLFQLLALLFSPFSIFL